MRLQLALRNVFRNKRRTFITLMSMVVGGAALIVVGGYIKFSFIGLRDVTIKTQTGHFQIYKEGLLKASDPSDTRYWMPFDAAEKASKALLNINGVKSVIFGTDFSGAIAKGDITQVFLGLGFSSDEDGIVGSTLSLVDGNYLVDEGNPGILVGKVLAERLDANVGDTLTVLVSTPMYGLNAVDMELVGIVSNGIKSFDERMVFFNMEQAQSILGVDSVARIIVFLEDTEQVALVEHEFQSLLASGFGSDYRYEYLRWDNLADFYLKVKKLYVFIFDFFKMVVTLVIFLSIANTMTMAVMERTSEIGTLRSLGESRGGILWLLFNEALILGSLGGGLAILVGNAVGFFINILGGIHADPPPGFNREIIVFIIPDLWTNLGVFAMCVVLSIFSSIIPAYRASRLKIVDAIRHV